MRSIFRFSNAGPARRDVGGSRFNQAKSSSALADVIDLGKTQQTLAPGEIGNTSARFTRRKSNACAGCGTKAKRAATADRSISRNCARKRASGKRPRKRPLSNGRSSPLEQRGARKRILREQPRLGPRRSDIRPAVRIPVENPHLSLYETTPDTDTEPVERVGIVCIVDGRRDLASLF